MITKSSLIGSASSHTLCCSMTGGKAGGGVGGVKT